MEIGLWYVLYVFICGKNHSGVPHLASVVNMDYKADMRFLN